MPDGHAIDSHMAIPWGAVCFSGITSWSAGKGYTEVRPGWYIQVPGGVSWIYHSPFQAELNR